MNNLLETTQEIVAAKRELDAALIQIETKQGLDHTDPLLTSARDAGDKLFSHLVRRESSHDRPFNYRQFVKEGGLRPER